MVKKVSIEEYYERACTNAESLNRKILTKLLDITDKRQKVDIFCKGCGSVKSLLLHNMCIDPRGCSSCKMSENFEHVVSNLESRKFFDIKRDGKKVIYRCKNCSSDEYVTNGVCSGVFSSTWSNLNKGQTSCRCSVKPILSKDQLEYKLTKTINNKYSLLSWVGEYKGINSKILLSCSSHGRWEARISDVLGSYSGCPSCATTGYSEKLPGTLYVLKSDSFVKIGITNLSGKDRRAYVSRKSKENFEVFKEWKWENGEVALSVEKDLLVYLRGMYKNPKDKFHGYTECFEEISAELLVKIIENRIKEVLL